MTFSNGYDIYYPPVAPTATATLTLQRPHLTTIVQCPQRNCGRQFNHKCLLQDHVKTHTGERPHVCPERSCGKSFTTSGNLSRHKRIHGYIEPLKCPVEGCICTFPSNNQLTKHMKFHFESGIKVCPAWGCGKTFSTTGNLNRHVKHHHLEVNVAFVDTPRKSSPMAVTDVMHHQNVNEVCMSPPASAMGFSEDIWNRELVNVLANIFDHDEHPSVETASHAFEYIPPYAHNF